jgi:predicted small secreted protein
MRGKSKFRYKSQATEMAQIAARQTQRAYVVVQNVLTGKYSYLSSDEYAYNTTAEWDLQHNPIDWVHKNGQVEHRRLRSAVSIGAVLAVLAVAGCSNTLRATGRLVQAGGQVITAAGQDMENAVDADMERMAKAAR